jgi:hypothetical protein
MGIKANINTVFFLLACVTPIESTIAKLPHYLLLYDHNYKCHLGRSVKESKIDAVADLQIEMHALKAGIYLPELVATDKTLRMQVLKK